MRHLFIIQCHEVHNAKSLANLLKKISSDFDVLISYDLNSISRTYAEYAFEGMNTIGFRVGYFTVDQALTHLIRFLKIAEDDKLNKFDYYHVISASDLPFMSVTNIDKNMKVTEFDSHPYEQSEYLDLYCQTSEFKDSGLTKASTWYGISNDLLEYIYNEQEYLFSIGSSSYLDYLSNNVTGGFDETFLGTIFKYLKSLGIFNVRNSNMRLIIFPEHDKSGNVINADTIDEFGVDTGGKNSPITLQCTDKVLSYFYNVNAWELFGRKFDFLSKSYRLLYNEFIKNIENGIKNNQQNKQ